MLASRRSVLSAGISALAAALPNRLTAASAPIVIGQVSLSFYAVTGAVVQIVLERLGHTVKVVEGPHERMFPLLSDNEIDLMVAAWLPEGHGAYWARYGQHSLEVNRLYEGARFFWAVPSYIPESELRSISDLASPRIARRMTKRIQGIGSGATITIFSEDTIHEYDLDAIGYELTPGTQAQWLSYHHEKRAQGEWFIFPTWAPQYLNRDGALRPLLDPLGTLGKHNHASVVAPRSRFEALPPRTRDTLRAIDIGMEGVTEMDWLVNHHFMSPREAAIHWMAANDDRVSRWLR